MYAAVLPALKLPRQMAEAFDYAVPKELRAAVGVGSVVLVPWRGRKMPGLVVAVRKTPAIAAEKVKPIAGLCASARMPHDLVAAITWSAERYLCAGATVTQCFLPAIPKRVDASGADAPRSPHKHAKPSFSGSVIRHGDAAQKMRETIAAVSVALGAERGAIVVVPHLEDVGEMVTALGDTCGTDRVVEFHGDMAMTPLWRSWLRAASGGPLVVVGTRMAVGAPVGCLGAIVITECDSQDLKQYDQNPRYDARAFARKRAELAGATLTLLAHAPRAEDMALTTRDGFAWRNLGKKADAVLAEAPRGARSAEERLLTPTAEKAISEALQSQKRVLLFHNRRGTASALVCRDCGRAEQCPTCELPLHVHGSQLHCHRCGRAHDMPLTCRGCGGPSFRTLGLGTGAVTSILAKAFPDARIAQIDTDSRDASTNADILVGTQFLLHTVAESPSASRFGAVIATSADSLLGHPGFRTTENAWRIVRTLADVATASGVPLVLQALDGESPAIRRLLEDPETFLAEELTARDALGFPPKHELLAVTTVGKSEDAARAAAAKLATVLKAKAGRQATVSGPHRPGNPLRHGTWRSLVVVRATGAIPLPLIEALHALPEDCIIDRDPDYLG